MNTIRCWIGTSESIDTQIINYKGKKDKYWMCLCVFPEISNIWMPNSGLEKKRFHYIKFKNGRITYYFKTNLNITNKTDKSILIFTLILSKYVYIK